ncbi:hypothetical protein ACQ86N_24730 [Puia sp. P3]|uniref:hypothetical protein n=1 Tax=Puia sp. P3 TaxID=3423952 RepID=UPI003D67AF87
MCPPVKRPGKRRSPFTGTPGTQSPKTPSNLSQDLKDLFANQQKPRTKIAQPFAKPTKSTEYFSKFMQIKGDKVVVDVTAKDDIATAKKNFCKPAPPSPPSTVV